MRVRPASRILVAPRPASQMSTSPTTSLDTETASHQANLPAQPNPSQLVLICRRLLVPPMVAPEATTGGPWQSTEPAEGRKPAPRSLRGACRHLRLSPQVWLGWHRDESARRA